MSGLENLLLRKCCKVFPDDLKKNYTIFSNFPAVTYRVSFLIYFILQKLELRTQKKIRVWRCCLKKLHFNGSDTWNSSQALGIQERIKIHLCFVADIHVLGLLKGSVTVFVHHWGPHKHFP